MPRLDDTAVEEGLQHLPGWERRGDEIVKTFVPDDFAHAMVFVHEIAGAAEAAGHHPDIDIRWNKVTLALSSHAQGGLTDRDFQLAARIQELDNPPSPRNRRHAPDRSARPSRVSGLVFLDVTALMLGCQRDLASTLPGGTGVTWPDQSEADAQDAFAAVNPVNHRPRRRALVARQS